MMTLHADLVGTLTAREMRLGNLKFVSVAHFSLLVHVYVLGELILCESQISI